MTTPRLEYLRQELRAKRMSWGELAELQSLADEIDPGDVELLEAAGVPEFPEEISHGAVCGAVSAYGHVCGLLSHTIEESAHECRIPNEDGSECYRQWRESDEVPQ